MTKTTDNSRLSSGYSKRITMLVKKGVLVVFLIGLILLAFLPYLEYPLEIWLSSSGLNVDITNPLLQIIGRNNYPLKMIVTIILSGLGVSIMIYILYRFTGDLDE